MPQRRSSMASNPARKTSMSAKWRAASPRVSRTIQRPSNVNWRRRAKSAAAYRFRDPSNAMQRRKIMKTSGFLSAALATLVISVSPQLASAAPIPALRGHDHTGITVPDIKAATAFFTDVIGCTHAMSFGPFSDDKGTFMQDAVNVNPRAVIEQIVMVRWGYGSNIELFQNQLHQQDKRKPKNSEHGA